MISFNINFRKEFDLADLIALAKSMTQLCEPVGFQFEYTVDLKDGVYSEQTTYSEKLFQSFDAFEDFFNLTDCRFDMLRLIQKEADHEVSFQQSQKTLRVFGRQEDTVVVENIVKLVGESILYAYAHDYLDLIVSRTNKYRSWKRRLGDIPNYVRYYDNPRWGSGERDRYLVDLESVPTHHHFIKTGDKLWFGACAVMYFSDIYYEYIPKEKWDKYTECVENIVLENGLRKVTLYIDFADRENSTHRDRQWQFRRQLDIDTVAHRFDQRTRVPEELLIPLQTGETFHMDWVSITDVLDTLQISSGQTSGKEKLREIVTQLEGNKVILVKMSDSSEIIKSREDLQSLINSYDARIVISEIL